MILDQFNLKGKVAIVTGCGSGLGQGMAKGLAEAGCDIFGVVYSSREETRKLVEGVGRTYHEMRCDLIHASVDELKNIVKEAVDVFGKVDILVNNAGIIRRDDLSIFSETDWDDVININLKAVYFLSQSVANHFIDNDIQGKIINLASMLSFQGGSRVPSYTASKAGIKGLTMSMANEWAKYGINCNAIAPGYMATLNTKALREDPIRSKEILDRIPANKWGTPEDLAGCCVFLASDNATYINGFTIAVDGGWLAR